MYNPVRVCVCVCAVEKIPYVVSPLFISLCMGREVFQKSILRGSSDMDKQ